jgi:hypothetical protein
MSPAQIAKLLPPTVAPTAPPPVATLPPNPEQRGPVASTPPPAMVRAAPAPVAPKGPAVVQVKLPVFQEIERSSLWVAETSEKPLAVLVIMVDPKDKPESIVRDKPWQDYAREHRLLLACASFAPKVPKDRKPNAPVVLPPMEAGLGRLLLSGVDSASPRQLPIIVYGRFGAGHVAADFSQWKSDRIAVWAGYANEWKVTPKKEAPPVPGLIVCDGETAQHSTEARDFFARGRAQEKPWTYVCLSTPWKERAGQVDQFFRDFLTATLTGNLTDEAVVAWNSVETFVPMSKLDRMTRPTEAVWLPDSQLTPIWKALMPKTATAGPATILQRKVATRNPKQPTLEMYLRLPRDNGDKPITGVLAFCTWEKDQAAILSKLDIQADDKPVDLPGPASLVRSIIRYAEQHHMAVLTWGTVQSWSVGANTEDLERAKQREFDRNFDLLANAWEHGLKELCHEAGDIPTDDILLYGMSRGAQWAHRLALRKPDHFLAVHVHIPSSFDKPTPEGNKPLWLLTTGELESGYERAQAFYGECQALNYPIMFKAIVGIGHEGSPIADALGIKFFDYALSVQAQRNVYDKQSKSSLARLAKQTSGPWLATFREPEFFGDFVNQECFPVAQVDMIPKSFRVPLPNKILAEAWNH